MFAGGGDGGGVGLGGGFQKGEPVGALGVGCVFPPQPSLYIGLADVQGRPKAFGAAECIGFL